MIKDLRLINNKIFMEEMTDFYLEARKLTSRAVALAYVKQQENDLVEIAKNWDKNDDEALKKRNYDKDNFSLPKVPESKLADAVPSNTETRKRFDQELLDRNKAIIEGKLKLGLNNRELIMMV